MHIRYAPMRGSTTFVALLRQPEATFCYELRAGGINVSWMRVTVERILANSCACLPEDQLPIEDEDKAFESAFSLGCCENCGELLDNTLVRIGSALCDEFAQCVGFCVEGTPGKVDVIGYLMPRIAEAIRIGCSTRVVFQRLTDDVGVIHDVYEERAHAVTSAEIDS